MSEDSDAKDGFDIEFMFVDEISDALKIEIPDLLKIQLSRAALRWETVIKNDLPDIDYGVRPHQEYNVHLRQRIRVDKKVDDLLIIVGQRSLTH